MDAIVVGIDVSKERLDVVLRPGGTHFSVARTGAGIEALVARNILEEGGAVSAAAAFAGYTSPANFSTAFRRRFGLTPRRARAGEL